MDDFSANNIHIVAIDSNGNRTKLDDRKDIPIRNADDNGTVTGRIWIDYCDGELEVRIHKNEASIRPDMPQASSSFNLTSVLNGGSSVFLGYTASSFDEAAGSQDILSWTFEQGCDQ